MSAYIHLSDLLMFNKSSIINTILIAKSKLPSSLVTYLYSFKILEDNSYRENM